MIYGAATHPVLVGAADAFAASAGFSLPDHTVALVQTGSHAYGTNTDESDEDYLAIVLPPPQHIIGLGSWDHWEPGPEAGLDVKAMSLAKFVRLALAGNPNLVEVLFYDETQFLLEHPFWFGGFRTNRTAFLSREVYKRHMGYAMGQMQKATAGKLQGYMGRKRKEAVQALGHDAKDASHSVRLLYTASDLARIGTMTPRLSGIARSFVLAVKRGEVPLAEITRFADSMQAVTDAWFQDETCPLPVAPDRALVEGLLMDAHRWASEFA